MAADIYFRSALSGYNKRDVISFIERLNSEQIERVNELNDRLRIAQTDAKKTAAELEEIKKRCEELEALLSETDATREDNAEKAQKYEAMQNSYANIMLEAEHTSVEKVRLAEEKAEKIIAEAQALKKKVVEDNKRIIENSKSELVALIDKLTASLDETLSTVTDNE